MSTALAAPSRTWLDAPVESGRAAGFGIYLHVPFCRHRCGYCDFATWDDRAPLIPRYVDALRAQVQREAAVGWPAVTSVFVGGGTPTLLPAADLAGLIATVRAEFDLTPGAEVTVEANPETVDAQYVATLVDAGVTRVSIGAQSFSTHVLDVLERQHDPERPLAAVAAAREAGIEQVSLDLIYGTPGESDADWEQTLATVLAAGTDHVSAYALTVVASTPLGRAVAAGAVPSPVPDIARDRFDAARDVLGGAGFDHYEVSNWARTPARRSRHNVLYWRHGDYIGFGVGAHAHRDGHRWWSYRSIERYLDDVESGVAPVAGEERLDTEARAAERLMLGLRLRDGLHPNDVPPIQPAALEDAMTAGLIETACGRLRATDAGWFLLDDAVLRLV